MISLDSTILYQIILTVVLGLVLSKILFQPYLRLLEEREGRTSGARHETADLEVEGGRLKTEYEERIARAEAAGNAAKNEILQAAREQRERILTAARDEASSTLERLREELQREMATQRRVAAVEAASVAQAMASKILGRNVA
ncbi:MAG TPA: ATP synthase F0 subunit B [Candidatus Binatia bacterium]|nr:ATP synthase F0 subunit B [Candidatus Binatia bacterium]